MLNEKLNKLNCMNYYVYDHSNGDHWYAQNGLRSLYTYSKHSTDNFRNICLELLERGEATLFTDLGDDTIDHGCKITLTMI